jgi:hypothetical protein
MGDLHLDRDKIQVDETANAFRRVRNCTHFLAAQSLGVEKIQENGLIGFSGGILGQSQVLSPTDLQFSHNFAPYLRWVFPALGFP